MLSTEPGSLLWAMGILFRGKVLTLILTGAIASASCLYIWAIRACPAAVRDASRTFTWLLLYQALTVVAGVVIFVRAVGWTLVPDTLNIILALKDSETTALMIVVDNILLVATIIVIKGTAEISWRQSGIAPLKVNVGRLVGIVLLGYVLSIAIARLDGVARTALGHPPNTQYVDVIASMDGQVRRMVLFLLAIVAPIVEEAGYRGVIQAALRRHCGKLAIVMQALVFAAAHGNLGQFASLVAFGAVLGWVVDASGSVLPAMVIHCLYNSGLLIRGVGHA